MIAHKNKTDGWAHLLVLKEYYNGIMVYKIKITNAEQYIALLSFI